MIRTFAAAFVVALLPFARIAMAAPPRSARGLLLQLADQAAENGRAARQAGHAADAGTWRGWESVYRKEAVLPQADEMSALDLVRRAEKGNQQSLDEAMARHEAAAAAFWRASRDFWIDLDRQLQQGGNLAIHFPEHAMLTPVAGLAGTPWGQTGPTATPSDCAAVAQRIRLCRAQVSQAMHDTMMGLGTDQSGYALVRSAQCHRWEEMFVAYCSAGR